MRATVGGLSLVSGTSVAGSAVGPGLGSAVVSTTNRCVALLILSLGCAHVQAWTPVDLSRAPSQGDLPDALSVVLLNSRTVAFYEEGGAPVADITTHVLTRYLRREATQSASLPIWFNRAFERISSVRARTILPDGTTREVDLAAAVDQPVFSASQLYNDFHFLSVPLPPVPVGGAVEVEYVVRNNEPALFQFSQLLGNEGPCERAQLEVTAPAAWAVEWMGREKGHTATWAPEISVVGDQRVYLWHAEHLEALASEVYGPPDSWSRREVVVRLAHWHAGLHDGSGPKDARGLSAALYQLTAGTDTVTPEMSQRVEAIVGEAKGEPTRVAAGIYDWVANDIDYCAIELGMGGWRPHAASEVFAARYGDCKDKANLLRTLLGVAGIRSRLAVVQAHEGIPREFALPTVAGNFNHMILIVGLPGGDVVVDPTAQGVPFGELPVQDTDADLLPLTAEGAPLQKTPGPDFARSSEELQLSLSLAGEPAMKDSFKLDTLGAVAAGLRFTMLRNANTKVADGPDVRLEHWLGVPGAEVEGLRFDPRKPGPAHAEGILRRTAAVPHQGSDWIVRLSELAPPWLPVLSAPRRSTPLLLDCWGTRHLTVALALPPGSHPGTLPPPVELKSAVGTYRLAWRQEGNTVFVERAITLHESLVLPEAYDAVRQFSQAALAAEARGVLIRTVDAKAGAAL